MWGTWLGVEESSGYDDVTERAAKSHKMIRDKNGRGTEQRRSLWTRSPWRTDSEDQMMKIKRWRSKNRVDRWRFKDEDHLMKIKDKD